VSIGLNFVWTCTENKIVFNSRKFIATKKVRKLIFPPFFCFCWIRDGKNRDPGLESRFRNTGFLLILVSLYARQRRSCVRTERRRSTPFWPTGYSRGTRSPGSRPATSRPWSSPTPSHRTRTWWSATRFRSELQRLIILHHVAKVKTSLGGSRSGLDLDKPERRKKGKKKLRNHFSSTECFSWTFGCPSWRSKKNIKNCKLRSFWSLESFFLNLKCLWMFAIHGGSFFALCFLWWSYCLVKIQESNPGL
jgi:hypothetical protein